MSKTILRRTLLLVFVIGGAGCGESPQQGTTPQPPAPPASAAPSPAPAQRSETAPAQSTMEVRPQESAALPPPPASSPVTPSQPATTAAPATAQAPAPSTAKPATVSAKGTLMKASELKEKPFIDAKTLASLPAQSAVAILERDGGWFRVQAKTQSGWVRMLNVKVTEGAQNLSSGTDLTQAATLATGRAGTGNIVSTSGLRGLTEEQLSSAKPDYAQFDKLNSYGADKPAASNYAKTNGLTGRSVQYLSAPAK